MRRVYELMRTVAAHDVPVLVIGETGTGKELVAREIHALGPRCDAPFVAYDCGVLSDLPAGVDLFGEAGRGTVFLDDLQNASLSLQARLLRVLELGHVRAIAASTDDLRQAVKDQSFRADLYYRMSAFPIELPPLRDRVEDIVPLLRHFLALRCKALARPLCPIDKRVEEAMLAHDWPGNVRELENAVQRLLLLTPPDEMLRWEALPPAIRDAPARGTTRGLDAQVDAFERRLIQSALDRNGGVIRRAARELEVNAITLARKMRRLGLDKAG